MLDPGTKAWVVSAIGKLMSQMGQPVGSMRDVLEKYASAVDVELRQVSTLYGMAYISTRFSSNTWRAFFRFPIWVPPMSRNVRN